MALPVPVFKATTFLLTFNLSKFCFLFFLIGNERTANAIWW